ncbi:AraC family transcriptional regulator [Thauera linaloolentis]|uniref:DNA-binding domain-containing protein n=1 Tax=Thauera linaloolentis (strain DSM 12138 / JCM 21573 / CCUG 41526 / CIP 105981 / IAM 15112 / NBRC 102519 / 47Lol) TaxID=1123367 RepID=N6XZA1_THAL4|nr:AraC family transcriptional regulator [Thauera linaloolentis]ENO87166.1 DNA-binding domain-containing protein [Thauera linaloolentis 47Lol = DSM 12138]MCM8566433.1 AraC family transcriptional regulator [Thauera linaloolentis]
MTEIVAAEARPEHERIAQCCSDMGALLQSGHQIEPNGLAPFAMHLSHFRFGMLEVFETRGSPHTLQVRGCSDGVAVLLNVAGTGSVRQGGREARLQPGSLHLLDDSQHFALELRDDFHHVVLRVPCSSLETAMRDWRALTVSCMASCCGSAAVFAGTLRSIFMQRQTLAPSDFKSCADAVLGLLGGMLRSFSRQVQDDASAVEAYHLERVKAFAHGRLADPDLDVKLIADAVGLSPSYIHRLFARSTMTLMQWITAERLDACHRELSAPGRLRRPVYLIAQEWGFSNQAHFSRVFRARFGVSPSDVRGGIAPCCSGAAPCTQEAGTDCANIGSLSGKARVRKQIRLVPNL